MNANLKSSSPALVTISLCLLVQAVEQFYQLGDPKLFELSVGRYETIVAFNVGLMLCLPWIGALGSIAAKAVGASREIAMRAAISPIALIAAMLMCLLVWDLTKTRSMVSSLAYSSGVLLGWVVIPAAELMLGALITWTLIQHLDPDSSRSVAEVN